MTRIDSAKGAYDGPLITVRNLVKVYLTPAGAFTALNGLDVQVERGEFAAVIGKSGSGKSTFINMLTGIDRPTAGEIFIGRRPIHALNETEMAAWRGRNLGIVFQFFQLIPTLTLVENVMLPMELNGLYVNRRERRNRALSLLEMVEVAEQADKLPSAVSGGQQQRVAVARAMANDPPLIIADEPTGNLDSRTAERIFNLFEELVAQGKTILMVTHDDELASRVNRTIVIADGEIVNEYIVQALAALSQDQLIEVTRYFEPRTFARGETIVRQGEHGAEFFIITDGKVDVLVEQPGGNEMLVDRLSRGHYFGEMALIAGSLRTATVRAAADGEVSIVALDGVNFQNLISDSRSLREELGRIVDRRLLAYRVQALAELKVDQLQALIGRRPLDYYPPGSTILRQGSLGDSFFVIVEGEVEVVLDQVAGPVGGDEKVLERLAPGQFFGELALLGDSRRSATVRASGVGAKVVELDRAVFEELITSSEQFRMRLEDDAAGRQERIARHSAPAVSGDA